MSMTEVERYLSKVDTSAGPDACWPWTGGVFSNGYGRFALSDKRRSSVRSHRYGYTLLVGPIPKGLIIRHTCDVPLCHNPAHWMLGTWADNSADMAARGRSLTGSSNPASRLTEAQVRTIKYELLPLTGNGRGSRSGTLSQAGIAEMFGVTQAAIMSIKAGRTWSHV